MASQIGLEVLADGGNVVDAAIATSFALGVSAPYGSGLGGKLVMLFRAAETGQVHCIEALCAAPSKMSLEQFRKLSLMERRFSRQSFAVPGLPAGLHAAHTRWGTLEWKRLVTPAAKLAETGVEVSDEMLPFFRAKRYRLSLDPEATRLYLVDGQSPSTGDLLQFPELARVLRTIALSGVESFYEGEIAEQIVAAARAGGSEITLQDFRNYQPRFPQPLVTDFHDRTIITSPPPSIGGATVLASLKVLESREWKDQPRDAVEYVDEVSRVLLNVYPRISREVADVEAARTAVEKLLSPEVLSELRTSAISNPPQDPSKSIVADGPTLDDLPGAGTSHLVVADAEGNIVCMTQSLSYHFGSSVVAPGTGILLNNSLNNFSPFPKSCNVFAPGKRPRTTLAPIIVTREGKSNFAFGIPGGQRIPTTTIQMLIDIIARGQTFTHAFEQRRFHLRRPVLNGDPNNVLDLEGEWSGNVIDELQNRGWQTVSHKRDGRYFGGGNGVFYLPDGRLRAVADSRRLNDVTGF